MRKKTCDELLENLPRVLASSMKDLTFTESMRQHVYERISAEKASGPAWRRRLPAVAAALLVVCLAGLLRLFDRASPPERQPAPYGFTEVEALDIDLDGEEPLELVNTWRVRGTGSGEMLLALIWERDLSGQLRVISTHTVEGTEFLPLLVLTPTAERRSLVLVTSTDGFERYYYCILGLDGGKVVEYRDTDPQIVNRAYRFPREDEQFFPVHLKGK
ncbi:MAG TPA: hypothetical protein GX699_10560 [Firmicutes bacterium]|nr:hypothetical protein [Bacillota bacterium]